MKKFSWLVCLSLLPILSCAFSSGFGVICDVDANYGCNDWTILADGTVDRHDCIDPDKGEMDWVKKPVRSDMYTTRAGDGEPDEDASTYIPDEYISLYIRSLTYGHALRGLMVHAVTADGTKVGTWDIPEADNPITHMPCSDPAVLLHTSAEVKPYRVIVRWLAPPAGYGTVTFRALIKDGIANEGEFYYPLADLVLTEAETKDKYWFESVEGLTCNQTCEAFELMCSDDMLDEIHSADNIHQQIANEIPCKMPFLGSCSGMEPVVREDGYCNYFDSKCQDDYNVSSSCNVITTAAADGSTRLCPCVPHDVVFDDDISGISDENEGNANDDSLLNSGASSSNGALIGVGAVFGVLLLAAGGFFVYRKKQNDSVQFHPKVTTNSKVVKSEDIQMNVMNSKDTNNESSTWEEYEDDTGEKYYYNPATKETSWEKPESILTPNSDVMLVQVSSQNSQKSSSKKTTHKRVISNGPKIPKKPVCAWKQYTDEATGDVYYHNEQTDQTVWDKPTEFF